MSFSNNMIPSNLGCNKNNNMELREIKDKHPFIFKILKERFKQEEGHDRVEDYAGWGADIGTVICKSQHPEGVSIWDEVEDGRMNSFYMFHKETVINELRDKYKPGTQFKDLVHGDIFTVSNNVLDNFRNPEQWYIQVEKHPDHNNKTARIWHRGNEAEIVNTKPVFEVGDIVVSLTNPGNPDYRDKGSIHKVVELKNQGLRYETIDGEDLIYCDSFSAFRHANPEEIKAYKNGIRYISRVNKRPIQVGDVVISESSHLQCRSNGSMHSVKDSRANGEVINYIYGDDDQKYKWTYASEFRKASDLETSAYRCGARHLSEVDEIVKTNPIFRTASFRSSSNHSLADLRDKHGVKNMQQIAAHMAQDMERAFNSFPIPQNIKSIHLDRKPILNTSKRSTLIKNPVLVSGSKLKSRGRNKLKI